jgi:hypothetical protein
MLTLLQGSPPPGPDICYLLGFCQTSAGIASDANLLFLASALVLAGVVVHRSQRREK